MLGCCPRPPPRTRARPRSFWQRASQTLFFDYENEDDYEDEKQSTGHFLAIATHVSALKLPRRGHFFRAQSREKLRRLKLIFARTLSAEMIDGPTEKTDQRF